MWERAYSRKRWISQYIRRLTQRHRERKPAPHLISALPEQRLTDVLLEDLLHLMNRLRDPQYGCPWDIKQTYASIVPHTLKKPTKSPTPSRRGDFDRICKASWATCCSRWCITAELAREEGRFEFAGVVGSITRKLIRRHPHVFPTGDLYAPLDVPQLSERAGQGEQTNQGRARRKIPGPQQLSNFDDVPSALPSLSRAAKLQKRASQVGFDW